MPLADTNRGFCFSELFRDLRLIGEGRKSPPETTAKRHHFVPKLLLKRFSRRKGRIWQLERQTNQLLDVGIEKAASRRRLYEFLHNDEGVKTSRMEAWLALIESHASKALRRIEHPGPIVGLADWDRATIAFFLAILSIRTPAALRNAEQVGVETMQIQFGSEWSDAESFAKQQAERSPGMDAEEIEELRLKALRELETGGIGYEDPTGAAMRTLVSASGAVAQKIFDSRWAVLRARNGEFVTSDVALAMHDPEPKFPWSAQAWQSSEAVQVTIPLSSEVCLLITPGPADLQRLDVDRDEVNEVNLRTLGWADRFLFGGSSDLLQELLGLAACHPELVIEPKPRRSICLVELEEGDESLAAEHRRRGWPTYLAAPDPQTGKRCVFEYMVVGEDGEPLEVAARATKRVMGRFRATQADPVYAKRAA